MATDGFGETKILGKLGGKEVKACMASRSELFITTGVDFSTSIAYLLVLYRRAATATAVKAAAVKAAAHQR